MSTAQSAAWRMLTATMVAVLPPCCAAPARAAPPPIDNGRLPRPTAAKPPQPTVQREMCAVPSMDRNIDRHQLSGLDLQQVWSLTRGSGQRVALIDTGVAPHPRLAQLRAGGDYVSLGDGTQDCDGHGTAVAGIIAARPDPVDDFSGIAPDATVISIRQSSNKFHAAKDSGATGFGDVDTMAQAVRAAADMGASVINISTVACARADSPFDDRALGAALSYAVNRRDIVVVAAAGNTGQCPPAAVVSPAWYDAFVLTVGSVNPGGDPSEFTLAGPWVDVAAPGEGVVSLSSSGHGLADALDGSGGSTPLSGTSYAAPVVSGLAALVRSRFPSWTAHQVIERIKATARHPASDWDPRVGAGVVDALAAVSTDSTTAPSVPGAHATLSVGGPPQPGSPGLRARRAAFTGAAVCIAALVITLSCRALRNILRD